MKKLFLSLFIAATGFQVHSQGTIAFGNSALTKFTVNGAPANIADSYTFGVFLYGTLVQPVALSSTTYAGIIDAPSVYPLPGTEPGQVVSLQIRGWASSFGTDWQAARASGLFGETDVRQVTLGPTAGPGTVIWQTASGVNPNRFYALSVGIIPEPSSVMLGALGVGALLLFRRVCSGR